MVKRGLLLFVIVSMFFSVSSTFSKETTAEKPIAEEPKLPDDPNYVVVSYNGKDLTLSQIGYTGRLDYKGAKQFADFWLNMQLLSEEAIATGFDKDAKTAFLADLSYKKEIAGSFLKKQADAVKITAEQVEQYYNTNLETDSKLRTPMYLSFSHITVADSNKAQMVLEKINSGGDINELAKEFSEARDASKGGRALKYQKGTVANRYGKNICDALLAAEEGKIIGPIKSKKGKYEIIRHEGKRASKIKELDKVSDYIKQKLESETKNNLVEKTIESLKAKAKGKYKLNL